jgi:N,N'-diacetyllegionaminate synthase
MNNEKVFIIAEIAQAHEGSLGIAHSYIDSLAETGVDSVKFQTHIAVAESSNQEPFRTKFSYEDETRFDYWKRMEFTPEQWKGLQSHCESVGLEFLSSPFSIAAVDLLEEVGVKRYKIGSGEVTNLLLLHRIALTGKPIIISSGMSSFEEIENAINFIKPFGNPITLLQCTTAYPTLPKQWGLNVMDEMINKFEKIDVGFSDHSGEIYACLAAAARGARTLEFHAVFDQRMFGPDAKASLTIDEIKKLVKGVREIEQALKQPVLKDATSDYIQLKKMFGKSLAINQAMKKGDTILLTTLESKKPADQGIPASAYQRVLGKKLAKDLPAYSFLNFEDLL